MRLRAGLLAAVWIGVVVSSASASPIAFSDNFNDGNADGWWLGYSLANPLVNGNWRVENGTLAQDQAGDGFIALVQGLAISTQSIETQVWTNRPSGYGGVLFWYQDPHHWSTVILYPAVHSVFVFQTVRDDAGHDESQSFRFLYDINDEVLHRLSVDADSATGQVVVFLDNSYLLTQQLTTTTRTGQSGLYGGNAGGYFDNFALTGEGINTVPEPTSLLLLGTGGLGLVAAMRRRRKQNSTNVKFFAQEP